MATDIADLTPVRQVAIKSRVEAAARTPSTSKVRPRGIVVPFMKKFCFTILGIAAFMTLLFLLDLFVGFPFAGASITLDIFGILGGAVVGYLAWDSAREIR